MFLRFPLRRLSPLLLLPFVTTTWAGVFFHYDGDKFTTEAFRSSESSCSGIIHGQWRSSITSSYYSGANTIGFSSGTLTATVYTGYSTGVLSGNGSVAGTNTYTGNTTVGADTTLLVGAYDAISDLSGLVLSGGNFSEGAGFSETLATLTVNEDSILNLVDATRALTFADSSSASWSGLLTITDDFISGSSMRFGSDTNGLTLNQLSTIFMNGISDFSLDASGYLVSASAVPEPSAYAALFGTLALGLTAYRRRRRA